MFRKINLLLFLFATSISWSQSLDADLNAIVKRMEAAKSVSIEVKVEMYGKRGGSLLYSSNASIDKMGDFAINKMGEMEFHIQPTCDFKVDHEEKIILVHRKKQSQKPRKIEQLDLDVEQIRKMFKSGDEAVNTKPTLLSDKAGIRTYKISGSSSFKDFIIRLDMNKKCLLEVSYEYDENNTGQYVVLHYTRFEYDRDLAGKFDSKNYFTVENNKYVASATLKGYKIYAEE